MGCVKYFSTYGTCILTFTFPFVETVAMKRMATSKGWICPRRSDFIQTNGTCRHSIEGL